MAKLRNTPTTDKTPPTIDDFLPPGNTEEYHERCRAYSRKIWQVLRVHPWNIFGQYQPDHLTKGMLAAIWDAVDKNDFTLETLKSIVVDEARRRTGLRDDSKVTSKKLNGIPSSKKVCQRDIKLATERARKPDVTEDEDAQPPNNTRPRTVGARKLDRRKREADASTLEDEIVVREESEALASSKPTSSKPASSKPASSGLSKLQQSAHSRPDRNRRQHRATSQPSRLGELPQKHSRVRQYRSETRSQSPHLSVSLSPIERARCAPPALTDVSPTLSWNKRLSTTPKLSMQRSGTGSAVRSRVKVPPAIIEVSSEMEESSSEIEGSDPEDEAFDEHAHGNDSEHLDTDNDRKRLGDQSPGNVPLDPMVDSTYFGEQDMSFIDVGVQDTYNIGDGNTTVSDEALPPSPQSQTTNDKHVNCTPHHAPSHKRKRTDETVTEADASASACPSKQPKLHTEQSLSPPSLSGTFVSTLAAQLQSTLSQHGVSTANIPCIRSHYASQAAQHETNLATATHALTELLERKKSFDAQIQASSRVLEDHKIQVDVAKGLVEELESQLNAAKADLECAARSLEQELKKGRELRAQGETVDKGIPVARVKIAAEEESSRRLREEGRILDGLAVLCTALGEEGG